MAALPILSPAGETAYMLPHDGEPPSRGRVKTAPHRTHIARLNKVLRTTREAG